MNKAKLNDTLSKAGELLVNKNYAEAIGAYNEVLAIDAKNIEALKGLGLAYFNLKELQKSEQMFAKVIEISSDDATALYYLASLYVLSNKTKEAIEFANKVIHLRPNYFDAYKILFTLYLRNHMFNDAIYLHELFIKNEVIATDDTVHMILATVFMMRKEYTKAIEFLKIARKINPDRTLILNNLGVCYMALKDYDSAINYFQQTINIEPDNVLAYTDIATALQIKGEYLKALEAYQKALELEPDNFLALLNVANLSNLLRRYDLAINSYEKLLAINPNMKEISSSLIGAYIKNKQPEKAINLIDKKLKQTPKNVPLLFQKAKIYTTMHDYNAATKLYEQILSFKKNSPTIYHAYGNLYFEMKDYDKALKYYNKSIMLDENIASTHKDLALVYLEFNQIEYAKDEFEKAIKLDQEDNIVLNEAANFYHMLSYFDIAEDLYKKSLKLEENPFTKLSLGINLISQNRLEEAFDILERLLSVLPENPELIYNLARIYYKKENFDMAARLAKKAYCILPTIEIANILGLSLKGLGDYTLAADVFEKIIEKYPMNSFVYEDLLFCYKKMKNINAQVSLLKKQFEIFPYNEKTLIQYVKTMLKAGDITNAKISLEKAQFENPSRKLEKLLADLFN